MGDGVRVLLINNSVANLIIDIVYSFALESTFLAYGAIQKLRKQGDCIVNFLFVVLKLLLGGQP